MRPDRQRGGIGIALITDCLARLRALGAEGCVVLGDPAYYGRFGFRAEQGLRYPGVPPVYFQAPGWAATTPAGIVTYHPGFAAH